MRIAIGCDHGGFEHKNAIVEHLKDRGFEVNDFGITEPVSVDYPDIALPLSKSVAKKENDLGILICGTGIGMSIAANKVKGVRAAVCSEHYSCKYTRLHNDSNVLCLGGRVVGDMLALELVDIFVTTEAEGDRHARRREKLTEIENMQ